MIIYIEKVDNGYVLRSGTEMDPFSLVVECTDSTEGGEVEAFKSLLWELNSVFGPSTSRHSAKRINIVIEPGDKYADSYEQEEGDNEHCE